MFKKLTLALPVLLWAGSIFAQQTVRGTVTSDSGEPLIGVNILVKSSNLGTVTDLDGNYEIFVPEEYNTLVFSYTGFGSKEVALTGSSTLDVTLNEAAIGLNEIVVTGYGTQIRSDLTGNIAKVTSKEIQDIPVSTFESSIQGRTAGVFIEKTSGRLGEAVKVRVRGNSSISASNQPLFVVDGVPITSEDQGITNNQPTSPLIDLNPNDIESVEVLKDASAAAIYGSRASNGVVLITTKRGKAGRTNFNVNYQVGLSQPSNLIDWLNADEYRELYTEATLRFQGIDPITATEEEQNAARQFLEDALVDGFNSDFETDTDWQDEAFRNDARFQQLDLSASGGSEKTRYYIGLGWTDQEGILIGNQFERINGRINLDQKAYDWLDLGMGFSMARTQLERIANDNAFATPLQLIALAPTQPARLADGEPNPNTIYYNGLIEEKYAFRETTVFRTLGNVYAQLNLLPWLRLCSEFGVDVLDQREDNFQGRLTQDGAPAGAGESRALRVFNYNTNNFFTIGGDINDSHFLEAVLGMSFQDSRRDLTSIQARGFPNDRLNSIASAAEPTTTLETFQGFSFLSYFLRANYKLLDRYLVSISGRVDASSKFGRNNRYGYFPAVSAGWIVSNEPFLLDNSLLSYLKLRFSWGLTGNAPVANFAPLGQWVGNSYTTTSGLSPATLPSPNLKWENTSQFNLGLDFGLFNDRLTVELDVYRKNTTDLLLSRPLPSISGFNSIFENVGEMRNEGLEIVLNSLNFVGAFRWSTSFNIAFNRNEVTRLNSDADIIVGQNRVREGEPLSVFVMRKYAGVDPANGDALYDDGEGGTTNSFNAAPVQVVGDPNPDFIGGFNNTFEFFGFDVNLFFQFVYGNEVYNAGGRFQSNNASGFVDNQTRDQLNRWRQPGDITNVPRAELVGGVGDQNSSRYLTDGSYLRFKTFSIGYRLPARVLDRLKLRQVRFFVLAQNLLTFTNYAGWDPEVNSPPTAANPTTLNVQQGVDFYTAPQPRTLIFGINLGF